MTKVVTMAGDEFPLPGEPIVDVVDLLRDLLERAEAGEIVSVACGVAYRDGASQATNAGDMWPHSCIGAIEQAKAMILERLM